MARSRRHSALSRTTVATVSQAQDAPTETQRSQQRRVQSGLRCIERLQRRSCFGALRHEVESRVVVPVCRSVAALPERCSAARGSQRRRRVAALPEGRSAAGGLQRCRNVATTSDISAVCIVQPVANCATSSNPLGYAWTAEHWVRLVSQTAWDSRLHCFNLLRTV